MSDSPIGPDWWQASDGKWYPPQGQRATELVPPGGGSGIPRTSGMAVTSLVLGIVSLFSCLPAGIGGLITGIMAKRSITNSAGAEKGEGMAVGGIVTSLIGILLWGVVVLAIVATTFLGTSAESKFSSVGSVISGY